MNSEDQGEFQGLTTDHEGRPLPVKKVTGFEKIIEAGVGFEVKSKVFNFNDLFDQVMRLLKHQVARYF